MLFSMVAYNRVHLIAELLTFLKKLYLLFWLNTQNGTCDVKLYKSILYLKYFYLL